MDQTVPARSLAFPELPQSAMVSPVYHFAQFSSRVRSNRNARRAAEVSAPYALHVWLACFNTLCAVSQLVQCPTGTWSNSKTKGEIQAKEDTFNAGGDPWCAAEGGFLSLGQVSRTSIWDCRSWSGTRAGLLHACCPRFHFLWRSPREPLRKISVGHRM